MKKRSIVMAMAALMAVSAVTGCAGKAVSSDSTISTLSSSAKKCFISKSPLSKLRGYYSRLYFF